ncbi:MAG TPA: OmpA family protein [Terriglobales bacterium]|nr:OmpA family protein [Terriglobales bacterium]
MNKTFLIPAALLISVAAGPAKAQQAPPARANEGTYRVTMIPRSILTINYENRNKTEIGFQGSPLMPLAKGLAKVESKGGRIAIDAEFNKLDPPAKFGAEYLTYVLWAITPEGKANNLGELLLDGNKSKLQATTTLQTFGLIVTAEPYYAVDQPSDVVVLENVVTSGTSGTLQQANVNYRLFQRGFYSYNASTTMQTYKQGSSKVPLELEEARNAVEIAKAEGAGQYAADTIGKADTSLQNAEAMLKKGDRKVIVQNSRDAVQNAAEAVQITIRRRQEETLAAERAAAAKRTADAQAAAQQSELERQRAQLESERAAQAQEKAELQAQQDAQARQQAEMQAQQSAQARAAAEAQSQRDAQAAAEAQQAAAKAEMEKQQLRAALLEQFNRILPTTDTPRGLKANLADVLFATAKFDLQPNAREALAKFSGIILAHPGLKLQVEGYTDSTGSDTFNQTLSENRANAVRAYLIAQNVDPTSITAIGYGKSNPVASNDTAPGRQQNRRVEIIISGEIIGTQIGSSNGSNNSMNPGGQPMPSSNSSQTPANQMPQQAPR